MTGGASAERSAATEAGRLEGVAARDLALLAAWTAVVVGVITGDALSALPQAAAALFVLLVPSRPRPLPTWVRIGILGAGAALAWLPGAGSVPRLARFLSVVAASTLAEGRRGRERGLVVLLVVLETGLAAALTPEPSILAVLLVSTLLAHRAVGAIHRARAASGVAERGGRIVDSPEPPSARAPDHRGALAVLVVAAAIFPVLPRARVPLLGWNASGGSAAGVGDELRPRGIGPIGDLDATVGRAEPGVDAGSARPPYLRATAFDRFEGAAWTAYPQIVPAAFDPTTGTVELPAASDARAARTWRLRWTANVAVRLPTPERTVALDFARPFPERVGYDAGREALVLGPAPFARDVEVTVHVASPSPAPLPGSVRALCLAVPAPVRMALGVLVDEMASGARGPRARARAISASIRGRCAYVLVGGPTGRTNVEDFLLRDRRGRCEHFASALAVCLRIAGVPARVAVGYLPSRWNSLGGFWAVRARDAHAWVEADLGEGWERLDATPAADGEQDPYDGLVGVLARWRDAAAAFWSSAIVGFDAADQEGAVEAVSRAWRSGTTAIGELGWVRTAGLAATASVLGLLVWAARRRRSRVRPSDNLLNTGDVHVAFYARLIRELERHGERTRRGRTAGEIERTHANRLSEEGRRAWSEANRAFEAVRYGGASAPRPDDVRRWTRVLRSERPRFHGFRWRVRALPVP